MEFTKLESTTEKASALLKALANEKRLMIVCILCKGEKNVGELEQFVGLSQSALSQHLARLRRDGIVDTRREAQTIYYSIKDHAVPKLLECLSHIYNGEIAY
ncbi:MAG: transcriptional regulator [Micavibrio aeruginosavorus]|uniref:Transcriptional regulator n=1 Tax=Micavibrio aeruginosavorus TaxID=349221 RepID=A0A2W5PYU9_9BACT|nr:MAG: transcriptional regulator [Micavibrio aeruginosavorus]